MRVYEQPTQTLLRKRAGNRVRDEWSTLIGLVFKKSLAVVVSLLLVFACSSRLNAQAAQGATGGLVGTVKDTSGAVIPGATVTITNQGNGFVSRGKTTSTGQYVFDAVLPGVYKLQVESVGFGTYVASGITIDIQQTPTINITLKPGVVTEAVTVTSATPMMQLQSAQLNQTVTGDQIDNLPLVSRDWTTLGQMEAGVTTLNGSNNSNSQYVVNGQSYNLVDFRLNGMDDNVEMFPSPGAHHGTNAAILPPPDAIQEFTLQSGGFSAETGHSLGAVVNAAVKSGTNRFRGDVWEYLRNDDFNANDFFNNRRGVPRAEYRQNQFGGVIGGPVILPHLYNGHNKTFFFFDWQSNLQITPGGGTATVPTVTMVSSGFTNLQEFITHNSGTQSDALGRKFPLGTVFDPETTRSLAPGATDPGSGIQNTSTSSIFVRDPFYTNGSIAGIKDFTGANAQYLNILPASRFDPNAIALLKLYPAQNQALNLAGASSISGDYFRSTRNTTTTNQFDVRGDQQLNDRNSIFAVFSLDHFNYTTPSTLAGIVQGGGTVNHYPIWEIEGGFNHTFTPTLLNVFTVGFNHAYELQGAAAGASVNPATFGIAGVPSFPAIYGQTPSIGVGSGLSGIGAPSFEPTIHTLKALQLNEGLTWTRGRHSATFGFEVASIGGTALQPVNPLGSVSFGGRYSSIVNGNTSYTGLSDFLLVPGKSTVPTNVPGVNGVDYNGGPSGYSGSNVSLMNYHRWYLASFAQDDWRVTPKLTLNLGVRWDYFGPQADVNGKYANMEFYNGNGPGGVFYLPNQTCGFPRSAAFNAALAQDNIVVDCVSNDLEEAQHDNFAPRFGFAYQMMPRFVMRGGYGIAFSSLEPRGTGQMIGQNYPFEYTVNGPNTNTAQTSNYFPGTNTPITLENAIASLGLTNPANISGVGVNLFGSPYKFQTPYTESTSFALEYAISHSSTLTTQYVGEFGRHLQVENVHNSPSVIVASGAAIGNYIPAPQFGANSIYETTNGLSSYHSIQAIYQWRMRSGDSIQANYTFAKCMQDGNEAGFGVSNRAPWLPGFGIRAEYQLCSSDAKNVVHGSATYHLPIGQGRMLLPNSNAAVNAVLGGWVLNGIYTYQGGQPFTVGCPVTDFSFFGCNANLVPGQNIYAGPHNINQWLNPKAFTQPPTFKQLGPNIAIMGETGPQARGPSFINTNASLFKEFSVYESIRVQFRAEAFNVFNQVQLSNPGNLNFTNLNNFSSISGVRSNARILQLALKLYY